MITHRNFPAWIVSGGNLLPKYLVAADESTNEVSCWIPSNGGKVSCHRRTQRSALIIMPQNFSVHWRDEGSHVHLCGFILLDTFLMSSRWACGARAKRVEKAFGWVVIRNAVCQQYLECVSIRTPGQLY